MNALITQNLSTLALAVQNKSASGRGSGKKIDLYGIKKLRELILELAVRGKLVAQSPEDEPASKLLERIEAEKARLVKEKQIKKQKPLPTIIENEKPFDLPTDWIWTRLGQVGLGSTGKTPSTRNPDFFAGTIPFIGPGQISPSGELLDAEKWLSEEGLSQSTEAVDGDILMVCIGGSIGKAVITNKQVGFNQQINAISPIEVNSKFLLAALTTKTFISTLLDKSTGSATPIINRGKWEELPIPVAPIKEQQRIVAKIDELMALCDQIEQQTEASLSAHTTLVENLLATLTTSANAEELTTARDGGRVENAGAIFDQNWQRIASHFNTLFTTEASIDQLKQTILQLAVMGKLVPQDPNDEPATKLLERIAAEKAQLVKEGKIKKQKPLPPITEDEKPFELPNKWRWGRLADMYHFLNGYAFKSEWFSEDGIRLLRNINIAHSETRWDDKACLPVEMLNEYERFKLEVGDIVISLDRPIINTGLKYAVITENDLPCLLLQRVAKFHSFGDLVTIDFLSLWLESSVFMGAIDPGRSNGVPHISTKQLEMTPFPILSLSEQHRIVTKVNQLITLCDQIKTHLQHQQQTRLHLADAMVAQALNPTNPNSPTQPKAANP